MCGEGVDGCVMSRVSEPSCFGEAPALTLGIFYPEPALALAPGKREHNYFLTTNCLKYVLTHVPVHVGHILCLL